MIDRWNRSPKCEATGTGCSCSAPRSRNTKHRWRGKRAEPAVVQDESGSGRGCRNQTRPESERFTQPDGRRLLREDRIRSCFDRKAVDVLGSNDAAQARRRFKQLKRDPTNHQLICGRQAADSAADDCNHTVDSIAAGIRGSRFAIASGSGIRRNRKLETGNWRLQFELMHSLSQFLHVLEWSIGQDAVAEIEDVPLAPTGAAKHILGGREQPLTRRQQQ